MRKYILCFLTFLLSGCYVKAQQSKAREIVGLALKKHTSGKVLKRFVVHAEYGRAGKTPTQLAFPEPLLHILDSIRMTVPDSIRRIMESGMAKAELDMFDFMEELSLGHIEENYVDLVTSKIVKIDIVSNKLKGRNDTTRSVYDVSDKVKLANFLNENPVSFLQLMSKRWTKLQYKEVISLDNGKYDVVQIKMGNYWWDVHFDKKSHILKRLIIPQVNNDPLIHYGVFQPRTIICFNSYQNRQGFLLPDSLEVIHTQLPLTSKKALRWISINKPLPAAVFFSVPSEEDLVKYSISEIGTDLFVMERTGDYVNQRTLIKKNAINSIQLFSEVSNSDSRNKKQMNILKSRFDGHQVSSIFSVEKLYGFVSLIPFFSEQTHLYEPKSASFEQDEKLRTFENPQEDSIRKSLLGKGLLTIFNSEIKTDDVGVQILNPVKKDEFEPTFVSYYLPRDKVIFFNGYNFSAESRSKNANQMEKLLYDSIKSRSIEVDKIVYSGAFIDNAPLFMTFQDFETRIKKTDFSIYDRNKK